MIKTNMKIKTIKYNARAGMYLKAWIWLPSLRKKYFCLYITSLYKLFLYIELNCINIGEMLAYMNQCIGSKEAYKKAFFFWRGDFFFCLFVSSRLRTILRGHSTLKVVKIFFFYSLRVYLNLKKKKKKYR